MNDLTKTIAFGVFGVALAYTAFLVDRSARPEPSAARESIGKPFYDGYDSTALAQSLQVSAVTPDAELVTFKVEKKDGLWTIPSHYNYPAEADERLSNTQASVMGILRETVAAEESSRHRLYGVIDPLTFDPTDEESYDLDSYGQRLTLYDERDEVLADFIIGKEVEQKLDDAGEPLIQTEGEKVYYIRREDEVRTYTAKLNIDLSTKFEDWIQPNLLQVEPEKLNRIEIDKYELQESGIARNGQISPMKTVRKGKLALERPDGGSSWKVSDFDETKETLVNAKLSEIVSVVQELTIADVRPKTNYEGQPLITPDLKVNEIEELKKDPQLFQSLLNQLQDEMSTNGFAITNNNGLKLVSRFGNIKVGTEEGISFRLLFGDEFTEAKETIDIQGTQDEDDSEEGSTAENSTEDPGRYMMIEVVFDEALLNPIEPPGTEPTKPTQPEGYVALEAPKPEGDEKTETPPKDERDPKFIEYDKQLSDYESASTEYELAKTRYESKLKERQKAIEEGTRKAAELNQRFGLWYYIIKADNLTSLLSERDDLVQPKAQDQTPESPGNPLAPPALVPQRPDLSVPELDLGSPEPKEGKGSEEPMKGDKGSSEAESKLGNAEQPQQDKNEEANKNEEAKSEEKADLEKSEAKSDGKPGEQKSAPPKKEPEQKSEKASEDEKANAESNGKPAEKKAEPKKEPAKEKSEANKESAEKKEG